MTTTALDRLASLVPATSVSDSVKANLTRFGAKHKRILQIGFNAGHSAALFLAANPELRLTCIDMGLNSYLEPCYELLREIFGDRITLIIASSLELTAKLDRSYYKTFDGVHVDGNQKHPWYIYDTLSCLRYLTDSAELIVGGTQDISMTRWINFLKDSILFGPAEGYQKTPIYQYEILQFTRPKVTVATVVVGANYTQRVAKATQSLIDYCDYWQLELVKETNQLDETRPIPWSKIKLLQRLALGSGLDLTAQVLVWIDADIVITNLQHSLDERILFLTKDKDFLIPRDTHDLNTGCFIMFNTPEARVFLDRVYQQTEFIHHCWWEQAAIIHLLRQDASRAIILPVEQGHILNAYYHPSVRPQWQPGYWLNHLASYRGDELANNIEAAVAAKVECIGLSQENLDDLVKIVVSLW